LCSKRFTSESELKLLEKHAFIVTPSNTMMMVGVDMLANVLEAMQKRQLEATVAFLRGLPHVEGSSSSSSGQPLFPDSIPTCPISHEDLEGPYSLPSIAPSLCMAGTKWAKQLAALEKWKVEPPLNSHGRVKKVGDTSIQLMIRSLEEYMGFCHKHLNLQPSMDLVMQCNTFSQFMAFKVARQNESSTMLRAAQQVSLTVPFVMSGHCPHAKAYSTAHAAQCKQWYSNLKTQYRGQVAEAPKKRTPISLATQWEAVDEEWAVFQEMYEVSPTPSICSRMYVVVVVCTKSHTPMNATPTHTHLHALPPWCRRMTTQWMMRWPGCAWMLAQRGGLELGTAPLPELEHWQGSTSTHKWQEWSALCVGE
jgi:hypothetical protein